MANPPTQYAIYLSRLLEEKGADGKGTGRFADPHAGDANELRLRLPPGRYRATWIDPKTGQAIEEADVDSDGDAAVTTPAYHEDVALRLTRAPDRK